MEMPDTPEDHTAIELITTKDGSHSLIHHGLDETYHSRHGALQESTHVFIKMGLEHWIRKNLTTLSTEKPLQILEIGMGTGLNVLLTAEAFTNQQKDLGKHPIMYHAIEPFPIPENLASKLNFWQMLHTPGMQEIFEKIHHTPWNQPVTLLDGFYLYKKKQTLEHFTKKNSATYDLIYFDAFAPNKQNSMWTYDILENTIALLNPHGVFVTYCAKGQLKRDLKSLGLQVETLTGPPGKAEMIRATKPQ